MSLAVGILLVGTVVARAAQSPTVPLPEGVAGAITAASIVDRSALLASSGPTPAADAPAATAPTTTPTTGPTTSPTTSPTTPQPAVGVTTPAASFVAKGAGTFTVVPVTDAVTKKSGRTIHFTVEVEDGLPVDHTVFADTVRDILLDARGWQTQDKVRFVPVSPAKAKAGARVDIRVSLTSPTTTDKLCYPLHTGTAHVSCWSGSRSVINLYRWVNGASTFGNDLTDYRVYLINHEVGHGLGHQHVSCPKSGARAPIMVQQTLGLQGCTAWPYPTRT